MVKLKIKVTKDILQRSMMCGTGITTIDQLGISSNCAIALAIRDIFPGATVGVDKVCFGVHGGYISSILPEIAKGFIADFDRKKRKPHRRLLMDEIEFEIEVPDVVVQAIDIQEVTRLLKNHPNLELVT